MITPINLEEFGVTIAGILILGAILKHAFPKFENRFIPLVTWGLGVLSYMIMTKGWSDPSQWLYAVITAAVATGAHSAVKNTIQDREQPAPTPSRFPSWVMAPFAGALLLTGGCTTVGTADIPRIALISREAAMIGTQEVLADHKDWRPTFALVVAELQALESKETLSVADILNIVRRLPVKELSSREARLSFQAARLLIAGIGVPEVDAERVKQLRPIVTAIREGIELGMQ